MSTLLLRLQTALRRYGVSGMCRNLAVAIWQRISVDGRALCTRLRLSAMVQSGRRGLRFGVQVFDRSGCGYRVVDQFPAGYAVRGLALTERQDGGCWLFSADVGDDTVSVLSLPDRRRARIRFAEGSAPIGVAVLPGESGDGDLVVANFNFDASHRSCRRSCLWLLQDEARLGRAVAAQADIAAEEVFEPLLCRDGHWGFRAVTVGRAGQHHGQLALTDRDAGQLHVAELVAGTPLRADAFRQLSLKGESGESLEPVGVTVLPGTVARYGVGLRNSDDLAICGPGADGDPVLLQRLPLGGRSRSSVACGAILGKGRRDLAIALWGGDPNRVDASHEGELVIYPDLGDGEFGAPLRMPAGINATDVVCGDFDGDGLDEVAVLNYGVGLSAGGHGDPGGITLYRCSDGKLKVVAQIHVPHPRIGLAVDIDGDGRDELIVSLFFARRLLVIDYAT